MDQENAKVIGCILDRGDVFPAHEDDLICQTEDGDNASADAERIHLDSGRKAIAQCAARHVTEETEVQESGMLMRKGAAGKASPSKAEPRG